MRVALVHRYFWPDTPPYANILRELALHLGDEGHEVTVYTCQPSYNRAVVDVAPAHEDLAPRVRVRRWGVLPDRSSSVIKAVNVVAFCGRLWMARKALGSADVVMAASTPPIVIAKLVGWVARRTDTRFVYHKQDIYPEVVLATGMLQQGRTASVLRWLDARTERAADRVVVLSADMADIIRSRGTDADRIEVINNFDPWSLDEPITGRDDARPPGGDDDRDDNFNVVFAGNLGRFQGIETIIEAIVRLRADTNIHFHFFGNGPLRPHIDDAVAEHQLSTVHLHGYQSPQVLADFLRDGAGLGIVSLAPGVIRAAYPSKTMSYLRNGCPVLALVEADSELARTVTDSGAGVQVDPSDPDAVAATIKDIAARPGGAAPSRDHALALYQTDFNRDALLPRWSRLFDSAVAQPSTSSQPGARVSGRSRVGGRIAAGTLLALSAPLWAVAAATIKMSSPGPIFFRANRVGLDGETFTMLKFRTMHPPTSVASPITGAGDARVFAAGHLLRRLKIDELPQLVNILRAEMAWVGPRPEDPSIVAEHYTPFMRRTLAVLPGLTSPGSLQYYALERALPADGDEAGRLYVAELLPRKIAVDVVYIRHRTWAYDAEVVLRTVAALAGLSGVCTRRQRQERAEAVRLLAAEGSDDMSGASQ